MKLIIVSVLHALKWVSIATENFLVCPCNERLSIIIVINWIP